MPYRHTKVIETNQGPEVTTAQNSGGTPIGIVGAVPSYVLMMHFWNILSLPRGNWIIKTWTQNSCIPVLNQLCGELNARCVRPCMEEEEWV